MAKLFGRKGEEKESKKDMKDEIKYMKKGGAPKSLIAKEKKEHAAEGYRDGGKVKKARKC